MVKRLEEIGYTIQNNSAVDLETVVVKMFRGLELTKLLEMVEQTFTPIAVIPVQRIITFNSHSCTLEIDYGNGLDDGSEKLIFIRKFINRDNEIYVHHNYCILPELQRGKGLIKPVFQESLRQYLNMGVKKIYIQAGLENGGYTWARFGFRAISEKEVLDILLKAKEKLTAPQFLIVQEILKAHYGIDSTFRSFPMIFWTAFDYMKPILIGSIWSGELDLTDPFDLNNFKNYVSL